ARGRAGLDDLPAGAGLLRGARPGGDEHAVVVGDVADRLVVAHDGGARAELLEVPDDGPDEAVVVVHDEDPPWCAAAHVASWIVVSLNGMYGAICGNSQVKQA